jgi:hypothetical protein
MWASLQAGTGYAERMALHHTLPVTGRHPQRHLDQDQSYTAELAQAEAEEEGEEGDSAGAWGRHSWRYAAPEHMDVLARLRAVSCIEGAGEGRGGGCAIVTEPKLLLAHLVHRWVIREGGSAEGCVVAVVPGAGAAGGMLHQSTVHQSM